MDDPLPSTPIGNATLEENDDFTEYEGNTEDDGIVLAQLAAMDKPIIILTPSANTPTQEAQDPSSKGDKVPQDPRPLEPCFLFPCCKFNLIFEQCFNALLFFGLCL